MKIKSLVIFMSGILLTPAILAENNNQQVDTLIKKINNRTQALEQQVKDLQKQIRVLKTKQGKLSTNKVNKKTTEKNSSNVATEVLLGGTPVITSPFFGKHSQYDGSDLVVNMSSINQDLRLLEQWQMFDKNLQANKITRTSSPVVELSGKVEAQANYNKPYMGSKTTDIDLSGLELDVSMGINSWASGFAAINYDNSPLATSATRASNSKLFVNKGFLTLGNLNEFPLYLTAGQFYVPFGQYSSFMISSPLTVSVGRTKARAILLGYRAKSTDGLYGSVYGFKGDSSTQSEAGRINQWGANVAYDFVGQGFKLTLGTSYINNMADASGMQDNGLGNGFKGFGASSATEMLQHRVPGADVQAKLSVGQFVLLGEYLTALNSFDSADLMYNNSGAKPTALNTEVAYIFKIKDKPSSFALGYGQTSEALALALPKARYSAALSTALWKNTIASLEYRHDVAYDTHAVGGGKGFILNNANMPILGKDADTVTLQLGVYF